jgi:hypothetical protein
MSQTTIPSPPTVTQPATAQTRGSWLVVARFGWAAVAALALLVFVANLPAELAALQHICTGAARASDDPTPERVREIHALGLSVGFFAMAFLVAEIVFAAIWFLVGVTIFWRRSDDRAALFVAFFLVTFGVGVFLSAAIERAQMPARLWLSGPSPS